MKVDWKTPEDAARLRALIAGEQNAKQRDRFRVVLLAGCGLGEQPECDRELIAAAVGRARQFVDQWVGRYRAGGIEALYPHKQPGAPCRLSVQEQQELISLAGAGPGASGESFGLQRPDPAGKDSCAFWQALRTQRALRSFASPGL